MNSLTKIQTFQRRRRMMITGVFFAAAGIIFYITNTLYGFLSHTANLPVFVICAGITLITYMLYRCPYCSKYPEESDVPLLNPTQCNHCRGKLK